jgi:hypothetical protein
MVRRFSGCHATKRRTLPVISPPHPSPLFPTGRGSTPARGLSGKPPGCKHSDEVSHSAAAVIAIRNTDDAMTSCRINARSGSRNDVLVIASGYGYLIKPASRGPNLAEPQPNKLGFLGHGWLAFHGNRILPAIPVGTTAHQFFDILFRISDVRKSFRTPRNQALGACIAWICRSALPHCSPRKDYKLRLRVHAHCA